MHSDYLLSQAQKVWEKPIAFFVRNWHMAVLVLLAFFIGGLYSIWSLPIESSPEVKIPIGTVVTIYPGASPADVEKLVTDKIEEQLKNLDDVKTITSDSSQGSSFIIVEFEASADLDESIRALRDEVDVVKSELPDSIDEDPVVTQIRADDEPVVNFQLLGTVPKRELKEHAEELESILEGIRGVSKVEIRGLPEKEMQVLLDIQAIESRDISVLDVTRAISLNHIDLPVGKVQTDGFYYQASLKGQFDTAEELENLVVTMRSGQDVFLKDIATVREVFEETTSETRIFRASTGGYDDAVSLRVFKKVGADLVKMVDEAKRQVAEYEQQKLPKEIDVVITDDFSEYIREDIRRLLGSAWQTVLIIALILFLALGMKEALSAASSVPILYLISFIALLLVGETFNFLTFFALILSLGVVVDTSIVVIEGIYEGMKQHHLPPKEAALASIATYRNPLISGTLTTICAFVPLALMTGIMGEYVKHIPITVNITLLSSLFVALMILPAIASRMLRAPKEGVEQKKPFLHRYLDPLKSWYGTWIRKIMESRKRRRLWIIGMIIALVTSFALPAIGLLKVQMFPPSDQNFFAVQVELPEGSTLEHTKRVTQQLEEMVRTLPDIDNAVTIYGDGSSNQATVQINLPPKKDRDMSSIDIAEMLRSRIVSITEADVTVREAQDGPPTGSPIEIRLLGDDILKLERFAAIVQKELERVEGSRDVQNDLTASPGEYHITLKRDRLEYFGVSALDIAQFLRSSVFGDDSTEIIRAGEETPIAVRLDYREGECMSDRITALIEYQEHVTLCRIDPRDVSEILNLQMTTARGLVPLSEMVEISLEPAVTTIRHFNGDRVVNITGDIQEDFVANDVLSAFQKRMKNIEFPAGVRMDFGGESEDLQESYESLGRAVVVGVLLIFAILVYQFGSFRLVLVIMYTIPFALVGVFYGLAILRQPITFPGLIGIAALAGIVVNDAIVLIDRINTHRKLGTKLNDAIAQGCVQRLEPVILTTLTTALGLVPLIIAGGIFKDLALVVAVGITFATVLTLVMIPIFYERFESGRPSIARRIIRWCVRKYRARRQYPENDFDVL